MLGKTVYLGLGSNVGNREEMLQTAIDRLHSADLRIERVSSVYESEPQRRRMLANGPRTIDIDILFFGGFIVETPELTIPHPRLAERRFVLAPMVELAPELRDPITRRTMRELLRATAGQEVRKVDVKVTVRE